MKTPGYTVCVSCITGCLLLFVLHNRMLVAGLNRVAEAVLCGRGCVGGCLWHVLVKRGLFLIRSNWMEV